MQQMARKPFMGDTNAPSAPFRQEPQKGRFPPSDGPAMVNHS
jgi:hypothetical protein